MSMRDTTVGRRRPSGRRWPLGLSTAVGLSLATVISGSVRADVPSHRLFIQIWWDAPPLEMDPSDDPGRMEVFVGDVFVGCVVAPSHMNARRQLMLVPPSVGFTATGEPSAVKVIATGMLDTLTERRIRITKMSDFESKSPPQVAHRD